MIQHLEFEFPEVSHKAGQWLIECLQELDCILAPIFNRLLINVNNSGDPENLDKLSSGLVELIKIVKHGGDLIIKRAYEMEVPLPVRENLQNVISSQESKYKIIIKEEKSSLLQLMVEICLLVLLKDKEEENKKYSIAVYNLKDSNKSFSREVLRVKVLACEFLLMILRQKYAPLGYLAVDSILYCLNISFEMKEITQEVFHIQLLNLLNIIFFDCDISLNKEKCKSLLESETFSEMYLKGLTKEDNYVKFQ